MPVDSTARARLRAAQIAESKAMAQVLAANRALEARRQRAAEEVDKLDAAVEGYRERVRRAQARLVDISGLSRAAALLGLEVRELKRAINQNRPHGRFGQDDN